jgi:hypothetical protein
MRRFLHQSEGRTELISKPNIEVERIGAFSLGSFPSGAAFPLLLRETTPR